jgi:hypothetical protein
MSVAITSANAAAAIHGCLGGICTGCGNTLKRSRQSRSRRTPRCRSLADRPCGSLISMRLGVRAVAEAIRKAGPVRAGLVWQISRCARNRDARCQWSSGHTHGDESDEFLHRKLSSIRRGTTDSVAVFLAAVGAVAALIPWAGAGVLAACTGAVGGLIGCADAEAVRIVCAYVDAVRIRPKARR